MEQNKITQQRIQIFMVIGIYLAIVLLLITIIVLVKNVKEIKNDPIGYGIERNGFESCTCYNSEGLSINYNSTGVIPKEKGDWNLQLPALEE